LSIVEKVYSWLKSREPLNVAFHRDADGVYSCALISEIFEIKNIYSPDRFGDYSFFSTGDKIEKVDLSLDLGQPLDDKFEGVSIDHHVHEAPYYTLIWDRYPTAVIVYLTFKDKIPRDKYWYVAGGAVGDGQPEVIPDEIWEAHPSLLDEFCSIYQSGGQVRLYPMPLYRHLSSPVNALCRIGGAVEAVNIVRECRRPEDLIRHPVLQDAQRKLANEERSILSNFKPRCIRGSVYLMVIESEYYIAGRIASKLKSSKGFKTFIVINLTKREMSMRGDLAGYIGRRLKKRNIYCGGHPGYFGGEIKSEDDIDVIIATVREMFGG